MISIVLIFSSIVRSEFINEEQNIGFYKNYKQEVKYRQGKFDSLNKPILLGIVF